MRSLLAWVDWRFPEVAYRIRPYDMIADRRRWCWQPRTPCGLSHDHSSKNSLK